MSFTSQPTAGARPMQARRPRRPILVSSHPGGRSPGVELPPVWFQADGREVRIASALPAPGDKAGALDAVASMSAALRDAAIAAFKAGEHPSLIGGDHSFAMGSLAAATAVHQRVGVIWVDAHPDFNTHETSPTGNLHGMPLAVACGLGLPRLKELFTRFVDPHDVVLVSARDIDDGEQDLLDRHGVKRMSVAEMRELGMAGAVAAIAERFGNIPVHLSFDFDAVSAEFFPATGTPVAYGLTGDEAAAFLQALVAGPLDVVSSDWVEFDPRHPKASACAELALRLYKTFDV